jgi:hypothetical protein
MLNTMCPSTLSRISLLALAVTLVGCATSQDQRVKPAAVDMPNVETCCASLAEALSKAMPHTATTTVFGPESQHFSFGQGLAPFVALRVDATAKAIELESPLQLKGWLYGGDGVARYVDARALFFDADGRELPATVIDSGQRFTGGGGRSLFVYVSVPPKATHMALTTFPGSIGKFGMGMINGAPSEPITSKTRSLFGFASLSPISYELAAYGPVKARVLPND